MPSANPSGAPVARPEGVPFSHLVSLVRAIAQIEPARADAHKRARAADKNAPSPARARFRKWLAEIRRRYAPLPPGTFAAVLCLLFPEADAERRYGVQEARLGELVVQLLGSSSRRGHLGGAVRGWNDYQSSGCLGNVVHDLFKRRAHEDPENHISTLTVNDVDLLLTKLARTSPWSAPDVYTSRGTTKPQDDDLRAVIGSLYADLPPFDAAVMTQIILKDLRPILYPMPSSGATVALLGYNASAVQMLTLEDALRDWADAGWAWWSYRVISDLKFLGRFVESNPLHMPAMPCVGTRVLIPKCAKGRGCKKALDTLRASAVVWAETKYDGERAQIHAWVDGRGKLQLKIFSKQGRDSTNDRHAVHAIIREALGYCPESKLAVRPKIQRRAILEAEMVAYSDADDRVDEFWHIRSLVENSAVGVRHKPRKAIDFDAEDSSIGNASTESNAPNDERRHLALIFFDVLLLDSQVLHEQSYYIRREQLEQTIIVKHGWSMLTARQRIQLRDVNGALRLDAATSELQRMFAEHVADYEEGLVLKAEESRYREEAKPWVKVKKDYIPGYGDCLDMVILGAGWDRERGRELRVGPATYTTFYLGALSDSGKHQPRAAPHFDIYFTTSYGLSRSALEEVNTFFQQAEHVEYSRALKHPDALLYSFSLAPGIDAPQVMLVQPQLAEIYGAGFTKVTGSKLYELRHPRITKVFRANERNWRAGKTVSQIQSIAHEVIGRPTDEDAFRYLWQTEFGGPAAGLGVCGLRTAEKRARTIRECMERLQQDDGVFQQPQTPAVRAPGHKGRPLGDKENADTPLSLSAGACAARVPISPSPPRARSHRPLTPNPRKRRAEHEMDGDKPHDSSPRPPHVKRQRIDISHPTTTTATTSPCVTSPAQLDVAHAKPALLPPSSDAESPAVKPASDTPGQPPSSTISYGRTAKAMMYLEKIRAAKAGATTPS